MNQRTYHSSQPYKYRNSPGTDLLQLLLFYILPFIIINSIIFFLATTKPDYDLAIGGTNDYRTTTITFTIKSFMPLKEVTIKMDSQPLDLEKVGNKKYQATIDHNGSLEIYMVNFNNMALLQYERIDILDDEPPTIEDYVADDGLLSFTIMDTQSGIDYSSIHGVTSSGQSVLPLSIDKSNGRIIFQMNFDSLTVSAKDMSGNEYLTTFSLNTVDPPAEASGEPSSDSSEDPEGEQA